MVSTPHADDFLLENRGAHGRTLPHRVGKIFLCGAQAPDFAQAGSVVLFEWVDRQPDPLPAAKWRVSPLVESAVLSARAWLDGACL